MNNRGQMSLIGGFMVIFIVIVVGLALFQGAAPNIGEAKIINQDPATDTMMDLIMVFFGLAIPMVVIAYIMGPGPLKDLVSNAGIEFSK